jgi:hypothetical protein
MEKHLQALNEIKKCISQQFDNKISKIPYERGTVLFEIPVLEILFEMREELQRKLQSKVEEIISLRENNDEDGAEEEISYLQDHCVTIVNDFVDEHK